MILQQFTSNVLVCQLNNFTVYNTDPIVEEEQIRLRAEKTKWLICIPPPPR